MRRPLFLVAVLGCVSAVLASPGAGWCERNSVEAQGEHAERVRRALEDFEVESPGLDQMEPESALLAVEDVAIAQVKVQARPGEAFRAPLVLEGAVMTLDLEPQSYRAPGFKVELRGPGGVTTLLDPGPVRTLLGTIREVPGSVVAGSLLESGLEVMVRLPDEKTLWIEPVRKHLTSARRDLYVVSPCGLEEGAEQSCGVERAPDGLKGRLRSISSAATNGENCAALGGCVADLLCDTDYAFYQGNNSSSTQVQSTVESIIALVNPLYADPQLKIRHRISAIVIRSTAEPNPYKDGPSLDAMAGEWGYGKHTSDLVHLFTGQSTYPLAGLSTVRGICIFGGYGMYSFTSGMSSGCPRAGIVAHELGHSWGALDSSGVMSPVGNTCNSSWIQDSKNEISNWRNQVDGICLDLDNEPPQPRFSFSCSAGSCSFDGSASTDDRGIFSYSWSFDSSQVTASASHTFTATGAYTVTLTVTDIYGLQASTSRKVSVNVEAPLPAESYFTVPPCRLIDTRTSTPLNTGQLYVLNVAGSCNIPVTAKAVSLNVGVASATGQGHLVFYPGNLSSGSFASSTINFLPDPAPRFDNAILRLATNGAGTLALMGSGWAGQFHLVLDIYGYFSEDTTPAPGAQGPLGYQTVTPCRIADTRTTASPLAHDIPQSFTVQGVCGIPTGAAVAVLNPVAVTPSEAGLLQMFPAGTLPPQMETLRFPAGVTAQANGARTRLAASIPDLTVQFSGTTSAGASHVILDAYGYFKADAPLKYRPVTACRLLDTRFGDQGSPMLAAGETRTFQVQGNCGIPVGAKAVMLNIVAVGPTSLGHLTAFASGTALPPVSVLNFHPSQGNLANGAILPLSTNLSNDLAIKAVASSTHLVVDVFGYFQ